MDLNRFTGLKMALRMPRMRGLLGQRMLCCKFSMCYLGVTAAGSDGEWWEQHWVEVSEGTGLLSVPLKSPHSPWNRNRDLSLPGKVLWDLLEPYSAAGGVPWEDGYYQNSWYWDTSNLCDLKAPLPVGAIAPWFLRWSSWQPALVKKNRESKKIILVLLNKCAPSYLVTVGKAARL